MFTYDEEKLDRALSALKIHELREVGGFVGVKSPSSYNFLPLKKLIADILTGRRPAEGKSNRGRPKKSGHVDTDRYNALLEKCRSDDLEYPYPTREFSPVRVCSELPSFEDDEGEPEIREGVLELFSDGYGILHVGRFSPGPEDAYLSSAQIRHYALRKGDLVGGRIRRNYQEKAAVTQVLTVNGEEAELSKRKFFEDFEPRIPDARIRLDPPTDSPAHFLRLLRQQDLLAPVGRGTRGLVVLPNRFESAAYLAAMAAAVAVSAPDTRRYLLLVDARPEQAAALSKGTEAEVVASGFDEPAPRQANAAELLVERAKRIAERGGDAVIFVDSLDRLVHAYREAGSEFPLLSVKKFFAGARKLAGGGSVTIMGTVRSDEAEIVRELEIAASSVAVLDGNVWTGRTGTKDAERLQTAEELTAAERLRDMDPETAEMLYDGSSDNAEWIARLLEK